MELRLPSFLRECGKVAAQKCAKEMYLREYLLRQTERELTGRRQRMVESRIRAARLLAVLR